MLPLAPCVGCARHVRVGEACPFCGRVTTLPLRRSFGGRMCRFALVAGIAIAASACEETGRVDAGEDDAGTVIAPYGTPSFAAFV